MNKEIADWTSEIGTTISHQELLIKLENGELLIQNIVDAATDTVVVKFKDGHDLASVLVNEEKVAIGRWIPEHVTLIPVNKFVWTDDFSWMRTLTCINHPSGKWYTKNPYDRQIFLIDSPNGFGWGEECPCSFVDMVVVCNKEGIAVGKPADAEPITTEGIPSLPNATAIWKRGI